MWLVDDIAKTIENSIRRNVVTATKSEIVDSQNGSGLNGGLCDVSHLFLRSSVEAARANKLSAMILFVDVSTAYVAVRTAFAVPCSIRDDQTRVCLANLGFSPVQISDALDEADRSAQWGFASSHLTMLASRLLVITWAAVDFKPGFFRTKGYMVGVPN